MRGMEWERVAESTREHKKTAADAADMTSTFYSALDLIAWSLKGEGLNYAVSSGENGEEYLLTKIHSGRRSDGSSGATEIEGTGPDVPDGVMVHVSSKGVNFPLTVSNSVREIVSKKWILPSLRRSIAAAERGQDDEGPGRGVELRQALDDSKSEFYNGGGSKLGGITGAGGSQGVVMPGSTSGQARQRLSEEIAPGELPEMTGSGARRHYDGEQMPGFEDEFQLQPGSRNDLREPFGVGPDASVPGASSPFGDFDLYPNGERHGHWGDPLGGAAGTAGGLGGLGGMYPQFDDPLFRGGGGRGSGSARGGSRGGRGGFGPNIRYDDPTGGSGGF